MEVLEVETNVNRIAQEKGWKVQPNEKKRTSLVRSLAKKARGKTMICPCKVFIDGVVPVASVRCPCGEADKDIQEHGSCHCGMFVKRD